MSKKTSKTSSVAGWVFGAVITLILIFFIAMLFLGFSKGWFNLNQIILPKGLSITDFDTTPGDCTLRITESTMCAGDSVSGTIRDGNNANCVIALSYNSGAWEVKGSLTTDRYGTATATETIETAGNYLFAVICIDENNVICRTNDERLIVEICDSDGDGFTDEEEEEAGTNPNDPYDYPEDDYDGNGDLVYTCGQGSDVNSCYGTCPSDYECAGIESDTASWCACLSGIAVHPDWKPDEMYYNPMDLDGPDESLCYDSDGANVFNVGFVTYLGVTHYDTCHAGASSYAVDEWLCIDDVAVEKEIQCPYSDCVDGRCMSGTTSVYNQCLNLGYKNGGMCICSSPPPSGCVTVPSLDTICGDLYPENPAVCCN